MCNSVLTPRNLSCLRVGIYDTLNPATWDGRAGKKGVAGTERINNKLYKKLKLWKHITYEVNEYKGEGGGGIRFKQLTGQKLILKWKISKKGAGTK